MRNLFKRGKGFLIPYLFLLMISFGLQFALRNEVLTFYINSKHDFLLDILAQVFTFLGDGNITLILFGILLFFSFRKAITLLIITNIAGLFAQIIKRDFFASTIRPALYFSKHLQALHFVPGVKIYFQQSFPSGHTTTAFSAGLLLAFYSSDRWVQTFILCICIGVAWSRIYLAEHFFIDVIAGSVLGSLTTLIFYYLIQKIRVRPEHWLNRSWSLFNRSRLKG